MDDLILRYYESEMRYLREAGKEFAKIHPDRASFLNLDRVGDRDPYVERLFEGFAFLTGRLRQKIDDDLPELTESLVTLLWPHYLRLIPSLSIVELTPNYTTLSRQEVIPKGLQVQTEPLGQVGTKCPFRTTQEVTLQPIKVNQVTLGLNHDGRSMITIRIGFSELADKEQLDLSCLRLYLNADAPIASTLHHALTQQVGQIHVRYSDDPETRVTLDGKITPVGFSEEDRLWLKPDNAFSGYQLLLEYFAFREKFMFVDLHGLKTSNISEACTYIDIELTLNQTWPSDMPFGHDNIRLHCVPVINLFDMEADPIVVNQLESEYLLRPLLRQDGHIEVYSVENVEAITNDGRYRYVPFTSFKHRGGMLRHDAPERYYHTRVRKGPSGLHDTWLILGGKIWDKNEILETETLSLRVTGTNGMLPRKALRNARIHSLLDSNSSIAKVRNLCSPTMPCYPPTEDRFYWRILSHLAPNYLSLMNAEVLRGTLALYDWTDNELNRRRLEGIVEVTHRMIKRTVKGMLQRGIEIEVTINSFQFSGEGDVMLFGELLHQFFALYADVNLFTQLVIISLPTGNKIVWNQSKASKTAL
ncbi:MULTISPECIES: type VI secretion system baseplate subunit TssF [unclassified Gilliamella]|uniref:type VI secretion system baseplate subunit TssF n=1 Tax=unclassified Gilliamella TaxID=2685620 RepID=UPI002269FEC1|nr:MULTISPECIES: type VI secretion system baseplate subunit TssF [unclassified Gilliamella]MCX8579392.1 type VI secretion system baseplate subunit TssF [Gilliamella sp. B2717]MCX8587680.1 type VI secretion system baseplate subunit TssF [Gilliamella sp. B3801]MCX8591708.1 type VI secretion system baseplate subunit TssF [Gilliamella sp. B3804]